jgi:mono/diheme cytochrome c family protein
MKNINTLACLLAAISGLAWLVSGCASTSTLAVQQAGYPKDKVDARGLFAESCARCHGEDGRARTLHGRLAGAQNFTDTQWQAAATDEDIVKAIQTGHKKMPAFQNKLSVTEIDVLAAYVRTFKSAQ